MFISDDHRAIWSLYLLGYPMSPAVWVGLIALLGVGAETGTFMLLYLDLAWHKGGAGCGAVRICAMLCSPRRDLVLMELRMYPAFSERWKSRQLPSVQPSVMP